jgi:hypothetical protein
MRRDFRSRRARTLAWAIGLLTVAAHAVIYGIAHTPPGFFSLHLAAGLAILIIVRNRRDADERAVERRHAYDAGRGEAVAGQIDRLEQRIDGT